MEDHDVTCLSSDSFGLLEFLLPPQELKEASTARTSLDGFLRDPLLLREDLKEGCGGRLWPAGILLAKYMLHEHRLDLLGKSIVELGAGSGLVGLAVAKGCSISVPIYITDQKSMLSFMEENIDLNSLSSDVKAVVLEWGSALPDYIPHHPAVILAADCVYFEPSFPLLISTMQELLGPESVCYFCFKKRRRADLRFMKQAKKIFHVVEIRDYPDYEVNARENLFLYLIRSRSAGQK